MPVFPSYYNPQLDQNDYRRNMMRVFKIEKNQDNNSDYPSTSSNYSNQQTPQSSVGKYEESLDSEMLSFDEKITVLKNTLKEVDDDMTEYKEFYDSPEFTTDVVPHINLPNGHQGPVHGFVNDANARHINPANASALGRLHKLEILQPPIESKINRAEGLLGTILNQYKAKVSGKHLNRYKNDEWIKIQQTFNKLFEDVGITITLTDIYKACIINKTGLAPNQKYQYHNPPANFGHRLKTTLDEFKSVFNSDKGRYSYNLGKY